MNRSAKGPTPRPLVAPAGSETRTVEQVAFALQVSKKKVYGLLAEGKLSSVMIGVARRITAESYNRLLSEGAPAPTMKNGRGTHLRQHHAA